MWRWTCLVTLVLWSAFPNASVSVPNPYQQNADLYHSNEDRYHPDNIYDQLAQSVRSSELDASFWIEDARAAIAKRHSEGNAGSPGNAKNVILFLGDGMSVPTMAAARTLLGQRNNQSGEEAQLSFESFPTVGLAKTYCVNAQTADSACTATAYLCGVKANSGTIGVTAAVRRRDCLASLEDGRRLDSIAAWALADGRDAGIVTTTRITHASPAGAYANAPNRNWENDAEVLIDGQDLNLCPDIAHQLVHMFPGNKFKVMLGGGRRNFRSTTVVDEEGVEGRRTDGRDLIEEWQREKAALNVTYEYIWNREQLHRVNESLPEYLLGLFEANHLQYNVVTNPETEPTLEELTEVAIKMLSRNEKGYFLFVEGGRIDHAHHDNRAERALDETIEFSKAVARAMELVSEEDTLIVVTADHAHVMSFNGYTPRGGNVLGRSNSRDRDNVPYMTLSYINGPGHRREVNNLRVDVTQENNFGRQNFRSHVEVPLDSETHGADDVAVFARGPRHALFSGLYEQNHVPHRAAYAACLGAAPHACSAATALRPLLALTTFVLTAMAGTYRWIY